ncbi:Penicillinase repressor [Eubacteriaceae bacterium CHKCI004]|nr:Penicillinase repressor [Eubacteriaceae bacterium CHKCI004]
MESKRKKLTDSEWEVMNLLWDTGEPLTSSEIIRLSVDRRWKDSYIHILINALLKKEMIRVAGFKKTTKNYARSFEPTMTREQWSLYQVKQESRKESLLLKELLESIINEGADEETLEELSDAVEKRKESCNPSLTATPEKIQRYPHGKSYRVQQVRLP